MDRESVLTQQNAFINLCQNMDIQLISCLHISIFKYASLCCCLYQLWMMRGTMLAETQTVKCKMNQECSSLLKTSFSELERFPIVFLKTWIRHNIKILIMIYFSASDHVNYVLHSLHDQNRNQLCWSSLCKKNKAFDFGYLTV